MEEDEPTAEPEQTEIEATEPPVIQAPPPIVDHEDRPVDPRSIHIARLIVIPLSLVIPLLPMAFITIGWALGGIPTIVYIPLLVTLLLLDGLALIVAYRFRPARYRHLRYRVDSGGLRIQRGVFWRQTIWIPITRVQHTDVSQGPLQRKYGLAKLTVHTAGTEGASIPLSGLKHGVATRLSVHLRPLREQNGD